MEDELVRARCGVLVCNNNRRRSGGLRSPELRKGVPGCDRDVVSPRTSGDGDSVGGSSGMGDARE